MVADDPNRKRALAGTCNCLPGFSFGPLESVLALITSSKRAKAGSIPVRFRGSLTVEICGAKYREKDRKAVNGPAFVRLYASDGGSGAILPAMPAAGLLGGDRTAGCIAGKRLADQIHRRNSGSRKRFGGVNHDRFGANERG